MKLIGIDLGGTTIKGGLVDLKGNIVKKLVKTTPSKPNAILEMIVLIIDQLSLGESILGIGMGSPGFIDSNKGQVLYYGGNINDWEWTDIKGFLRKKYPDKIIAIDNDANVAALCENWLGSARNLESFIMITIGTGLGGAIYTSREGIWNGHNFQGGELGHAILYPQGKACKCGQLGCVEKYVSGSAIQEDYQTLSGKQEKGEQIFKLHEEDDNARKVLDNFIANLVTYLISLRNIFDPQAIVIGGGLINSSKYWWDRMMVEFEEKVNFEGMDIVPATYLNDSGIIGSAKMVVDRR